MYMDRHIFYMDCNISTHVLLQVEVIESQHHRIITGDLSKCMYPIKLHFEVMCMCIYNVHKVRQMYMCIIDVHVLMRDERRKEERSKQGSNKQGKATQHT